MSLYFAEDGTPKLQCPFIEDEDEGDFPCDELGRHETDPEVLLDHLTAHHDSRTVARAFMHLEIRHADLLDTIDSLSAPDRDEPADRLFGSEESRDLLAAARGE